MIKDKILGTGFIGMDIIKYDNRNIYLPGGTCANVISVLAYSGWDASLIKANYYDNWNVYINGLLSELNIKMLNLKKSNKQTPRVIQTIDEGLHKFYTICPQCGRKLIDLTMPTENDIKKIEPDFFDCKVFFYDRISSGVKYTLEYMNKNNRWTIYEPNNGRFHSTLFANIADARIVKFSSERISVNIANKLLDYLEKRSSKTLLVIVTHGENGVSFTSRHTGGKFSMWSNIEPIRFKKIIDTSGAGDWLTAGFLDGFIKNYPFVTDNIRIDDVKSFLFDGQLFSKICCENIGALGKLFDKGTEISMVGDHKHCTFCLSDL
ncbi:MAG: PfkB family carbohydrate kinase [Acholeplasma sp.]|nr:PfkB family carbohydrate kinase [Acholeplasma sp.]